MRIAWIGLLAALLTWAGIVPAAAQTAPAPSFDCARATTAIEQAICRDPDLAAADATMARLFAAARTSAFGNGPSNLMPGQVAWLRERQKCTIAKPIGACLVSAYQNRNHDLAVAALFAESRLALATLRKVDPETAPLYEALFVYASHAEDEDWTSPALAAERKRVIDLLRPQYARLQRDPDRSFAREMLNGEVAGLDDATTIETNFTTTLKILAASVDGRFSPMTIPCAAIVRRPGMQDATAAMFGSALDVGLPVSDCDVTLPPLPGLDALVAQINAGWPKCEGTIRFSAYRGFAGAVDGARLGSHVESPKSAGEPGPLPRMDGVRAATTAAAYAELSDYYMKYRDAVGPMARLAAYDSINDLFDAGHECGGGEE